MEFKFKINSTIKDNIINATLLPSPMNFIPASVSAPIQTALTSAPASVSSKSESTSLKIKPKASDFEKKYQYLKLSANVKNGLFYKTQKTLCLCECVVAMKNTPSYIYNLTIPLKQWNQKWRTLDCY